MTDNQGRESAGPSAKGCAAESLAGRAVTNLSLADCNAAALPPCAATAVDLSRWVEEYAPARCIRYAYRLTGFGEADAEDLTQAKRSCLDIENWLNYATWSEAAGLADGASCAASICEWVAIKHATERRLVVPLDVDKLPAEVTGSLERSTKRLCRTQSTVCPEAYKVVLVSFYFEDFSYRDIAERLDLPVGTVMSRLSRAKAPIAEPIVRARELQLNSEPESDRSSTGHSSTRRTIADPSLTDPNSTTLGATEWPRSRRPEGEP